MKEIFIIEDEILVATGIEEVLTHNNYKVLAIATSYEMAKQKLFSIKPDLILCDINLKGKKSGIDLMKEIERKYTIPYIFISAYSDLDTLKEADKLSPVNYLTKPFSDKQLLVSIKRCFASLQSQKVDPPAERGLTILRLVSRGYSTRQIAEELSLSFNTIESHRKALIKKYEVNSMAELVCLATDLKWITYRVK